MTTETRPTDRGGAVTVERTTHGPYWESITYRNAEGQPHREDGPARIVTAQGRRTETWCLNGRRERRLGPGIVHRVYDEGELVEEKVSDGHGDITTIHPNQPVTNPDGTPTTSLGLFQQQPSFWGSHRRDRP